MVAASSPAMRSSTSIAITAFIAGLLLLPLGLFGPDLTAGLIYLAIDGHYDFQFSKHSGLAVLLVFLTILVMRGRLLICAINKVPQPRMRVD